MIRELIQSPLVKVSLRYGAIGGLLCFGFVISIYYMGQHPFLIYPYFDFRIPVFAFLLFFCVKEIRDYDREGSLSFFQAMMSCLIFTFVFATIASGLIWIFCVAQPEFLSSFITEATGQIKALPPDIVERVGKEQLERNLNALPLTHGSDLAIDYFGKSFIMSFFISVIISVILRRQPSDVTEKPVEG